MNNPNQNQGEAQKSLSPEDFQKLFLARIYPEIRVMSFRMQEINQTLTQMGRTVDPEKRDQDAWFHISSCLMQLANGLEKKLRQTEIVIARPEDPTLKIVQ